MDLGLGDIGAIAVAIASVLLLLPLIVGGVFVILIVANRADPDPSGRRPAVVYSYAVSFITLFIAVFASVIVVARLASLIGTHHAGSDISSAGFSSSSSGFSGLSSLDFSTGPQHLYGDGVARGVVVGLLLLVVAAAMYVAHVRVADRATEGLSAGEPAGRVRASYAAAVAFVSVMIIVVSAVGATYQVFRVIAPGVFNPGGAGSHVTPLGVLIPLLYLAYVGVRLLRAHAGQLPAELRPNLGGLRRPAPEVATPE